MLMHLIVNYLNEVDFSKALKAKVIKLTRYA